MEHLRKFWRELRQRPVSTVGSTVVLFLLFHLPVEAVASWINEQIAEQLGINKPTMGQVVQLAITWGLPFIGATAVMVAYHAGYQPQPPSAVGIPSRRRLSGLELWYLAGIGFAVFAIGEVLLNRSAKEDSSIAVILSRLTALENSAVPLPAAQSDPRIDALIQQMTELHKPGSLAEDATQIRQLEICEARLAELTKPLEQLDRASRAYTLNPYAYSVLGNGARMSPPPTNEWDNMIAKVGALERECPLSNHVDFTYVASDRDVDTPCRDEPSLDQSTIANVDNIHRYRRFCHKADFNKDKVQQFKTYVRARIGALERQLVP